MLKITKKMTNEAEKFLKFFGPGKILCYSYEQRRASKMRNFVSMNDCIVANNNDSDVYFYVNNGGTKTNNINELRAFFVDIDAGRDKNGNYLPTKQVMAKKGLMRQKVLQFPVKPHLVVETRNGYHLYWLLAPTKTDSQKISQWNAIQNRINNFFADVGADSRAKKINQIMRVPGFFWRKTWANKKENFAVTYKYQDGPYVTLDGMRKSTDSISTLPPNKRGSSWSGNSNHKIVTSCQNPKQSVVLVNKNDNHELIVLVRDFLLEIAPQLAYKGMKFSSKTATELSNRLTNEFCIS